MTGRVSGTGRVNRAPHVVEQEALRKSFEADLAAANLGRLMNSRLPMPGAPVQTGRAAEVVALLASQLGFVQRPVTVDADAPPLAQMRRALAGSQMRTRKVTLDDDWWARNLPPLAVTIDGGLAAILPGPMNRGILHQVGMAPLRVTEEVAARIAPDALEIIRALPTGAAGTTQLFMLATKGVGRNLLFSLLASIAVGVIGLSVPLATALVFDEIVPSGDVPRLVAITVALVCLALAAGAFSYMRIYEFIRASDSMEMITGGAVLDRILRLPASALRQWSSAALASRVLVASALQTALSDAVTIGVMSLVLAVLNGILLVVLIPVLGAVALAFGAALVITMLLLVRLEARRTMDELDLRDAVDEVTLDLLRGWLPVRMTDGDVSGFGRWAAAYTTYRQAFNRRWNAEIVMEVVRVGVLGATLLSLVIIATLVPKGSITSATFLAFLASFAQFSVGVTGLMVTIRSMARIAPSVSRLAPLLGVEPEVGVRREDPGQLLGAVEVRGLGFRYGEDHPWVLRDVTFRAEPGSFVAIVGTSGSGKSTLLRLLLGFEQPRSGVVMYDDSDLAALDVEAVRRQFGVVLQASLLLPGTIRENVTVSTGGIPDSKVWDVLARVDIDDAVRAMPQGLDTVVDEGSSLLSGGQRQRILLARALANQPTVVFLDEATSALDNLTQRAVTRSIGELGVTRIVIAHRLSTIRGADSIVVLDGGRVVEQGTYDDLIARDGLFASLVERQEL